MKSEGIVTAARAEEDHKVKIDADGADHSQEQMDKNNELIINAAKVALERFMTKLSDPSMESVMQLRNQGLKRDLDMAIEGLADLQDRDKALYDQYMKRMQIVVSSKIGIEGYADELGMGQFRIDQRKAA